MSLQLKIDGVNVSIGLRRFPAGETFLRLAENQGHHASNPREARITLAFEGNDDLFNLALLVDALRWEYGNKLAIHLLMPYLPYARQDRVCSPGESLSIKVVARFVNSLKLAGVYCWNVHSDVSLVLFENFHHRTPQLCYNLEQFDKQQTILVSPDAGANKKVDKLATQWEFRQVVRAEKNRDLRTNEITGTVVYSGDVGDKDFLIVDDICDGGRTFTELAKELKKLTTGEIMLYVTHGIFSYGMEVFDGLVDKLYITNPVGAKAQAAVASGKVVVI